MNAVGERRKYFTSDVPLDVESERLLTLQAALDPLSTARLNRVGVAPGWACLEVGAGRGSIARWLAEAVAPRGRVVATDTDTRLLEPLAGPNLEVRRHDICFDDLEPGAFDLVHCRQVLMHVADPPRALDRMVEALRPGGWLVVEEPVYTEPLFVSREHPAAGAVERVYAAFREFFADLMDVEFGSTVMQLVAGMGLEDFSAEQTRLFAPGGCPGPLTNMLTWDLFREELIASGALVSDDFDVAEAAMRDPSFIASSSFFFGVFARKPR